jgi:hypothetical protein
MSPEEYVKGRPSPTPAPSSWGDSGMSPDEYVAAQTAPPERATPSHPDEEKGFFGKAGDIAYNLGTALTGGAPPSGPVTADSFWPVRLAKGLAHAIHSGATAPRDVLAGELDPNSPEGIARAMDVAGITTMPLKFGRTSGPGTAAAADNFIRQQLPSYVDKEAKTRATSLMDDAAARGVRLTWPEALSQVTGKPVLLDMQRVLEGAKQTRATMAEAIGDRPSQIKAAAESEIAGISPPATRPSTIGPAVGEAATAETDRARSLINRSSEPYYDAAATHRLDPAEMASLRARPGMNEAIDAVRRKPEWGGDVQHLPDDSIGFLNQVKKYLDAKEKKLQQPVNPKYSPELAARVGRQAGAVRDAAIASEARGGEANYAQALDIQQEGRRQYLNPLLQGPLGKLAEKNIPTKNAIEALFPSDPLAGSQREISTAVEALARHNETAARQLVRAHVEQKLNEAFDAAGRGQEAQGYAGASFAHRLAGSPAVETQRGTNFRAAVEALPNGKQIWPGIERFLEIARATGTRRTPGSPTGYVQAELKGMGTGGSKLGHTLSELASPGNYLHLANDLYEKWQTGRNLGELARIITDPKSEAIFRSLAKQSPFARNAVKTAGKLATMRMTDILGLPREPLRVTVTKRPEDMPLHGQ